ncbi:MAG: carboxypeptidase regulatory-like domain-containing protein [Chlorobium phaeobacteroides]|nr:carboxypeptidase regulatory-like domain-containing protein [Chlorobium phaeobacteroides]MBL6956312.1 carboxypeptidase regulatory-like domain-containing protein [Chlorobium phaeobacteroides]
MVRPAKQSTRFRRHTLLVVVSVCLVVVAGVCGQPLASASTPSPDGTVEEPLLVELFFGEESIGTHLCYRNEDDFWIPFSLFLEHARLAEPDRHQPATTYKTTLGAIVFDPDSLRSFEGVECLSFSTIKTVFRIHVLFNRSLYAIKLLVPWRPSSSTRQKKALVTPDIPAPGSSLSFLHFEGDLSHSFDQESTDRYLELEAGGRIGGGIWDIMGKGDPQSSFSPSRYHWTTLNRKTAFRVGTGTSQMFSLLGDLGYTGIQVAWNNRSILPNIDNERYSDSDVLLSIDRTQRRTIDGSGPPAGIAELRFDGRIVARRRISLDGRFAFRNVRMSSDLRITEVYLYAHSLLEEPIDIIDYTRSIVNRSLASGELLFHGAFGRSGNILADETISSTWTGFGHTLYGLSERITIESAVQHNPRSGSLDLLFGPVMSIGSRWNTALYSAYSNNRFGLDAALYGYGKTWRFSHRSRWYDNGFGYDTREQQLYHTLRLQTRPFSWFNALLYGSYEKEGNSITSRYLLPGGTLYLSSRTRISAMPFGDDGAYRYEAFLRPRWDTDVRLRYEENVITADINHDLAHNNTLQFIHSFARQTDTHASSAYLYWYPDEHRNNRVRLGASYGNDRFGFTGSWSRYVNAGLNFILTYNHNMYTASGLSVEDDLSLFEPEDNRTISLSLTWDLGRSGKRFYPINRSAISYTRGGMAGSLKIMTDAKTSQSSINDVAILVNGRRLGQRQIGGTFFVGNLRPGIYTVSVDPENLPVELAVKRQNIKVEVQSGAVTEVTIPVYAEYGISGKVTTASNRLLTETQVSIIDSVGKILQQAKTDRFGYYRVDGLRKGNYTAQVSIKDENDTDLHAEKNFSISTEFLFGIDIIVPDHSSTPEPPVEKPAAPAKQPEDQQAAS